MVRRINEDRRAEIQAARDAWEAEYNKKSTEYDNQKKQWYMALRYISKYVEDYVLDAIGDTTLNLDVRVEPLGGKFGSESYEVKISSDDSNKFDDNVALSWNYDVYLDKEGNPKKESGSWSGLKATTPEQIGSLEETLRVLKKINNIDWTYILSDANKRRPNWDNYIDVKVPSRADRPKFEQELKIAQIEDIMGKPILIKGESTYDRGDSWYLVKGATPKQYKIIQLSPYSVSIHKENGDLVDYVNKMLADKTWYDSITKDRFLSKIKDDAEIMEIK